MSDVDDLVAALAQGDPDEEIDTTTLYNLARAAIRGHWIPCPHTDFVTLTARSFDDSTVRHTRTCERCHAQLVVETEDTDG